MLIDAHTHIGNAEPHFSLSFDMLKALVEKYKLDYVVVSNIEAVETIDIDNNNYKLVDKGYKPQAYIIDQFLELFKNDSRFIHLVWCKPHTEGCTEEFKAKIKKNLDKIKGLKFHPWHSKLRMTSPLIEPYIELARECKLPILVHCATDIYSRSKYVYECAKKYPDVNFIMAHLQMIGDYDEAIEYLHEGLPNLYADTAWLPYEVSRRVILNGNSDKIMFGTDAPIGDKEYFKNYKKYFVDAREELSKEDYDNLMYKNALRVYKI